MVVRPHDELLPVGWSSATTDSSDSRLRMRISLSSYSDGRSGVRSRTAMRPQAISGSATISTCAISDAVTTGTIFSDFLWLRGSGQVFEYVAEIFPLGRHVDRKSKRAGGFDILRTVVDKERVRGL